MKTIKMSFLLGQILFLLIYNLYCYINPINRTGIDFIFVGKLSFVFGILILFVSKLRPNLIGKTDKLILSIFVMSILIFINILVFDYINVMVDYEEWFHRNSPEKPFWKH